MSGNKIIPIIAGVLCVVVIGSVFGVSALNKKSGKNNIEQPSVSQTDSASQTVTAGNAQTDDETEALTSDGNSTANSTDAKSESASSTSGASSAQASQNAVTTVTAAPSSSETSSTGKSTSKSTASTTKTTKTTKKSEYMYAYAGFNPVTTDMSVPIERLLLNRKYKLPDGYVPKLAEAVKGSGVKLDYRVAPHYQEMYNAAKKDGITLTPVSGYRSYQRQKNNFDNQIKTYMNQGMNKVTATQKAAEIRLLPGTSEHNAGLAMDICSLSTKFDQTKEFRWLQAHAHEYGFIMRYPKDKTNVTKITYEPWHYRYVGKDIAKQLKSSGQVLEEYLGKDA